MPAHWSQYWRHTMGHGFTQDKSWTPRDLGVQTLVWAPKINLDPGLSDRFIGTPTIIKQKDGRSNMNKFELFLTISGGVVYWQTPGLKGQKWLIDSIDVPFQYCFDLKDNRGAFAVYNHRIKDEHYVSVNCGVLGKDDRGRPDAPYRFHAILPWVTYKELGADAFALARWAFSKEVLGRRYGSTKGEGELFSPQVYKNFPPELEVDRRPDMTFLEKHLADQQQLAFFLGALIAGVTPPLRFRDEEPASQWSTYDPWSERIPTNGERLLEELYLCLPYETRSLCNISTGWKQCDFKFQLALDNESSDNAAVALKRVVDALDENARRKVQAVVERYVNPLFQAIEMVDVQSINQLRRAFTMKSIAWQSEKPKPPVVEPPIFPNNGTMARALIFIGAILVSLLIGFGMASLFSSKGDNFDKDTAELERLKGELSSAEETKGSLQTQLGQAQAKIQILDGEITLLKQEQATTADNNSKTVGESFVRLRRELTAEKSKTSKLEGELTAEKGKTSGLEGELTAEKGKTSGLEGELTAEKGKTSKLEGELQKLREASSQQPNQISATRVPKTTIVINEIAWMGTTKSVNDEWIELYNYGESPINLNGWKLIVYKNDGGWKNWKTQLSGQIEGGHFMILRKKGKYDKVSLARWKDDTFGGVLWNGGEYDGKVSLKLIYNKNQVIDQVDRWYAGSTHKNDIPSHRSTMERKNPKVAGNNPSNWCAASRDNYNWQGEKKPYDTGTPGTPNTCAEE